MLNRIKAAPVEQNQRTDEKIVKESKKKHHDLSISKSTDHKFDVPAQKYEENINVYDNNSIIQVKILYETSSLNQNINQITDCKTEFGIVEPHVPKSDINENSTLSESLIKGQTLLTSFFRPIQRKRNDSIEIETVYNDHDDSFELIISDNEKTDKHLLLCGKRILRKYRRLNASKYLVRRKIIEFLVQVAQKSRKQFATKWHRFPNKNVTFVYQCLISYHRFITAYVNINNRSEEKSKRMTTEAISINRRVQKLLNDNPSARETHDENVPTTQSHSDAGAKRLPKNQRTSDNSRQLLLTENAQESSDFRK